MVPEPSDKIKDGKEHPIAPPVNSEDLRSLLKRKPDTITDDSASETDLRTIINKSRARKIHRGTPRSNPNYQEVDLHNELNSKSDDLRIKLNHSKDSDLRRHLEAIKQRPTSARTSSAFPCASPVRATRSVDKPVSPTVASGGSSPGAFDGALLASCRGGSSLFAPDSSTVPPSSLSSTGLSSCRLEDESDDNKTFNSSPVRTDSAVFSIIGSSEIKFSGTGSHTPDSGGRSLLAEGSSSSSAKDASREAFGVQRTATALASIRSAFDPNSSSPAMSRSSTN
ncbi:hypothetical protein Bca4012_010115 [Brassica carinata]